MLLDHKDWWVAIDPKCYIGEPEEVEFEISACLKNQLGFLDVFLDKKIVKQ